MTKIDTPSFFSLIHDGNCFTKKTDKSQLSRNIYSNNAKIACLFHLIYKNDKKWYYLIKLRENRFWPILTHFQTTVHLPQLDLTWLPAPSWPLAHLNSTDQLTCLSLTSTYQLCYPFPLTLTTCSTPLISPDLFRCDPLWLYLPGPNIPNPYLPWISLTLRHVNHL